MNDLRLSQVLNATASLWKYWWVSCERKRQASVRQRSARQELLACASLQEMAALPSLAGILSEPSMIGDTTSSLELPISPIAETVPETGSTQLCGTIGERPLVKIGRGMSHPSPPKPKTI